MMMFDLDEDLEPDSGNMSTSSSKMENPFTLVSSSFLRSWSSFRFNTSASNNSLNRLMLEAAEEEDYLDSPTAVQVRFLAFFHYGRPWGDVLLVGYVSQTSVTRQADGGGFCGIPGEIRWLCTS